MIISLTAAPASALSPSGGFSLIRKVPPGEELAAAVKFLGNHTFETIVDVEAGIKLRRWGEEGDSWGFSVLHDGREVKATSVKWNTKSVGEQQTIFAQLTGAGKKLFAVQGKFVGAKEVRWTDFDGRWLIVAKYGSSVADGVTLLSGIRSQEFDSGKYGF